MKFKYIEPQRLKVIMMLFFGTGMLGISIGLSMNIFMFTTFGTVNLCLGGLFGWIYLTQPPKSQDKRKKKRDDN